MTPDPEVLYALAPAADVPDDAWKTRLAWTGALVSKDGKGYIELHTEEQLASAAEASFAGRADVNLLSFSVDGMREEADLPLKPEAGAYRVHGEPIPFACLRSPPVTLELIDGKHVFPLLGAAAIEAANAQYKDGYESDAATDDGLEPFNQLRFDLDDDDNELLDP